MDKRALAQKIQTLDGLSNDEKSALLELLNERKKYGIVWEDKPEDVEIQVKSELPVLTEVKERAIISDDADAPNHILIEGDNLHALSALSYTHAGKIDVIYIDPPYNTGKSEKDFKYNDMWVDADDDYRNSKWLSFMNKRLKLAKHLLSANGIIFISIDDYECAALKMLCDEIFNTNSNPKKSNNLGVLVWDLGTGTQAGHFTRAHEYILVYAKNRDNIPNFSGGEGIIDHSALKKISKKNPPVRYTFKAGVKFEAPDGTELKNEWGDSEKTILIDGRMVSENGVLKYDVTLEAGFAMISQMKSFFSNQYTVDSKGQHVTDFYFNSTGVLHYKKERSIINPPTLISEVGSTKAGSTELFDILGKTDFDYPKPISLIQWLLNLQGKNITILDFFAGSGTTMHATMELNKDGGHRQCILVTNNENNICKEVTYVRNQRVIQGYTKPNGETTEGLHSNNLRYYKTTFVPRKPSLKNRRILMSVSTELLCIKNDVYQEQSLFCGKKWKAACLRFFANERTKMLIIYDEQTIPFVVSVLKSTKLDSVIRVYVFSNSRYAFEDDFTEILNKVELCALPAAIYDAYQNVLPQLPPEFLDEEVENHD